MRGGKEGEEAVKIDAGKRAEGAKVERERKEVNLGRKREERAKLRQEERENVMNEGKRKEERVVRVIEIGEGIEGS